MSNDDDGKKALLAAAERLTRAAEILVQSQRPQVATGATNADSPAWSQGSNENSAAVGHLYYLKHIDSSEPHADRDTLARIYANLFRYDPAAGIKFNDLHNLHDWLTGFDPTTEDGPAPASIPGGPLPKETHRQAINRYLAQFNVDPTGPAPVATIPARVPTAAQDPKLSHAQVVELWHVLYNQEDIRLLAPYDFANTKPW
jgi:hypothetical protein